MGRQRCGVWRRSKEEEEAPPRNRRLRTGRRAGQGGDEAAADVAGRDTEGVAGLDEDEDVVRTGSSRWGG